MSVLHKRDGSSADAPVAITMAGMHDGADDAGIAMAAAVAMVAVAAEEGLAVV